MKTWPPITVWKVYWHMLFLLLFQWTKGWYLFLCRVCLRQVEQVTTILAPHQQHMKVLSEILGWVRNYFVHMLWYSTPPKIFKTHQLLLMDHKSILQTVDILRFILWVVATLILLHLFYLKCWGSQTNYLEDPAMAAILVQIKYECKQGALLS